MGSDLKAVASPDHQWAITERWQQYEGELRTNILRMGSIALFYSIHLVRYLSAQADGVSQALQFDNGPVPREFHIKVTLIVAAWTALAGAIHFGLSHRKFPRWLPYGTTCLDLVMLTCVLLISNGPRSPMVNGYFLILTLAALRLDLRLVRLATIGAVAGYVCLLGLAKWPAAFGQPGLDLQVPRYHQMVVIASLVVAGILLGQVVRRVRVLATDYACRTQGAAPQQTTPCD